MTLEELGSKLQEVDDTRRLAQAELEALTRRQEQIEQLEKDRDILFKSMAEEVPDALEDLTPQERNKIYRMLCLETTPFEGGYEVSGAFCSSGLTSPLWRQNVTSWGRGSRRFDPRSVARGPVGLTEVCVEAVLKASPILPTPLDAEHSFVGFDGGEGGFEEPDSNTARGREKIVDPSAIFQRIFRLLRTVAQELQEPHYILMPYEHRNAA
jgi:hypothetical protein